MVLASSLYEIQLKHQSVWFLALQLSSRASQVMPSMKGPAAVQMLCLFMQYEHSNVQLLAEFAQQFRYSLFIFDGKDLLNIVRCFLATDYNPMEFLSLCAEYLMMRLSEFSVKEVSKRLADHWLLVWKLALNPWSFCHCGQGSWWGDCQTYPQQYNVVK